MVFRSKSIVPHACAGSFSQLVWIFVTWPQIYQTHLFQTRVQRFFHVSLFCLTQFVNNTLRGRIEPQWLKIGICGQIQLTAQSLAKCAQPRKDGVGWTFFHRLNSKGTVIWLQLHLPKQCRISAAKWWCFRLVLRHAKLPCLREVKRKMNSDLSGEAREIDGAPTQWPPWIFVPVMKSQPKAIWENTTRIPEGFCSFKLLVATLAFTCKLTPKGEVVKNAFMERSRAIASAFSLLGLFDPIKFAMRFTSSRSFLCVQSGVSLFTQTRKWFPQVGIS